MSVVRVERFHSSGRARWHPPRPYPPGVKDRFLLDIMTVALTDDAGVERRVPFLDVLGPPRGFACTPPREVLWSLRRSILRDTWVGGVVVGSSVILGASVVAVLLVREAVGGSPQRLWLGVPIFAAGLAAYDRALLPIFRRLYRPAFLRACHAQSLCPMCLYRLPASGPVTCPECGARWTRQSVPTSQATVGR